MEICWWGISAASYPKWMEKRGVIIDHTTLSGGIWSKPVIDDGKVYIGVQSGDFYALDEKNLTENRLCINTSSSVIASPCFSPMVSFM